MNIFIVTIMIFLISALVIEMFIYAFSIIRNPDRSKIRKKLRTITSGDDKEELPNIFRRRVLSDVPALNEILLKITGIERLDRLLHLANIKYPLGFFVLLSIILAVSGSLVCFKISENLWVSLIVSVPLACIPFLYIYRKKKKRMRKFECQLPDALELIASSLKAGHAFSTGLKLVIDEFGDPLGTEFSTVLDEINFGTSFSEAMKNLATRIDCPDIKFFIIAVLLQRESGGKLAELIENIAHVIRERFRFEDKVKSLSAEGRISMIILVLLPFALLFALYFVNPQYIEILFIEPAGRIMLGIGAFMMMTGVIVMRKMVNIKV